MGLSLELPSLARCESYSELVDEFQELGEKLVPFCLAYDKSNFDALLAHFAEDRTSADLPDGFVPHTTFWLVHDDKQVVAVSNMRHTLTPRLMRVGGHIGYGVRPSARNKGFGSEILRLTLLEARKLGIRSALITCGNDNLGSIAVILRNGGKFESEEFVPEENHIVQRYRIDLLSGASA